MIAWGTLFVTLEVELLLVVIWKLLDYFLIVRAFINKITLKYTTNDIKNCYEEHENKLKHIEWPPQSPGLTSSKNCGRFCKIKLGTAIPKWPVTGIKGKRAKICMKKSQKDV